jgi:hypothetical protein
MVLSSSSCRVTYTPHDLQRANESYHIGRLQEQCTTRICSRTAHPRTWPADQLSGDTVKETRRQDIANLSHGASFRRQQSNSYRSSLSSQVKSKRQVKADQNSQESIQGIVCCKKTIINTVELESNKRENRKYQKEKNRPRQAKDRSKSPVIQVKTRGERQIFGSTKEALEIVGKKPIHCTRPCPSVCSSLRKPTRTETIHSHLISSNPLSSQPPFPLAWRSQMSNPKSENSKFAGAL